jgi:AraC-like DNA-binding protein
MALQRVRSPELEHDVGRTPNLGYEPAGTYGFVRFLEHGFPNPLVRWHYHEEYELHLIVATRGKVFVGDYIGQFEPGHLVLTGPRLPHNWISTEVPPEGGVALRDMVLQFADAPLRQAAAQIPELAEALPLLERRATASSSSACPSACAAHGRASSNCTGCSALPRSPSCWPTWPRCTDYRLLSSVQLQSFDDDAALARSAPSSTSSPSTTGENFSMADLCARLDMSESSFSRYFRRATGNTFTDFVNRLRINKACQLLMETDRYITNVCYDVGFNNVANFNRRFLRRSRA